MDKYAFFSMDVESLYDSLILYNKGNPYNSKYSYEELLKYYIELLDKYNIKATFFVTVTSLPICKDILEKALQNGHEIGLHGLNHRSPMDMTNDEFRESIRQGKKILENVFNTKVIGYRAPMFGINDERIEILKEEGFIYDSSDLSFHLALKSGGISLDSYTKDATLIHHYDYFYEFSLAKVKAYRGHMPISGGGYIRLVPWFVMKYYLLKFFRKTDSYLFYCHPFELCHSILPKLKNINKREWLYIHAGRFNYLRKIKRIIQFLKRKKFKIITFSEYIKAKKMQEN